MCVCVFFRRYSLTFPLGLGFALIETVDGEPPYMEFPPLRAYWLLVTRGLPPPIHACSPELLDFLTTCTSKDPNKRLALLHDRDHAFLSKADATGLQSVIHRASEYNWSN